MIYWRRQLKKIDWDAPLTKNEIAEIKSRKTMRVLIIGNVD